MSELKQENCPFCGSKNISAGEVSTDYAGGHGAQCTQSRCDDCGALGPEADLADGEVDYGDVKAITAWNRRTQPEATAPAQDLSAAILAIELPAPDPYCASKGIYGFTAQQMRDLLKAAAALASSASALSAGDRVDAITDAQRIDYIESWNEKNTERGFAWNTLAFNAKRPVREQLDELIAVAILQS